MSKYIVERKKSDYSIFAWISVILIVFNVFHTYLISILMGENHFSINISILTFSVLSLLMYVYFENKLNIERISFNLLDYLMIAAFLIIVATSANSLFENSAYILRYVWLIFMVFFIKNDDRLARIVFITLFIAMLIHLVATLWFYFDKDFYWKHIYSSFNAQQRAKIYWQVKHNNFATGFAAHYSLNGMYMAITSVCAFSLIFYKKHKNFTVVLFIVSVITLFMTGKRAVLLFALFAFLIAYIICNKGNIFKKTVILIAIILGLLVVVYVSSFYIKSVEDTIGNVLSRYINPTEDISNGRFILYQTAWDVFLENPVLGIGWGEFAPLVDHLYFGTNSHRDVHNVYLQLLAETGIIGFIVFMSLFIYAFTKTAGLVKVFLQDTTILPDDVWMFLVSSFCYQIFFFSYCMTGNPLYDLSTMYVYFFSVGFTSYIDTKYGGKAVVKKGNPQYVSKYIRRP